jgi:hypothetical protein
MTRQQEIRTLARRWADRRRRCRDRVHYKEAMGVAFDAANVSKYMRNWLCQHGCLPEGIHKVPWAWELGGRHKRSANPDFPLRLTIIDIDFTRLRADPGYPRCFLAGSQGHACRVRRPPRLNIDPSHG